MDLAVTPDGRGYWLATGNAPEPPALPAPAGGPWAALRRCESGDDYGANTGNGFYGAYQFTASTWRSMGTGYAYAHEAPYWVQDDAAMRLQARAGWGQWPACSRALGLR
ncbi:MAG: transglycosylase family protein [Acidimicrobiia bacterium]|nr:transglycosylase family protein [Acidimicrobiia bacterium]